MEIKQAKSEAAKIADRLKGSGDPRTANAMASHGTGPNRTKTNVHHGGHHNNALDPSPATGKGTVKPDDGWNRKGGGR